MVIPMFRLIITLFLVPITAYAEDIWLTVGHINDGDTFTSTTGERVRLLNINAPESGNNYRDKQSYGLKAKQALIKMLPKNTRVRLVFDQQKYDRYDRFLAHVYLEDGTWLNAKLIEIGAAHVYTFPENLMRADDLLKIEKTARANALGLWKMPRWKVRNALDIFSDDAIGRFHFVQGIVKNITKVNDRTYLNFGDDWRTDFTIEIKHKFMPSFEKTGLNLAQYVEKTVLVRGFIKPVNGAMISVSHPEQIQVIHNLLEVPLEKELPPVHVN